MSDETTELQGILDEFEYECYMLRVEASETRARNDVVRKAYERIRDEFAGRIAATLGSGMLTAEQVRKTVEKHWHDLPAEYDMPEATALPEYSYDWQAIADELNATLGGGECKWVWVESWTDTTDGRECDYAHWMPDCGCWSEGDYRFSDFDDYEEKPTGIVFCERCGKAVKR